MNRSGSILSASTILKSDFFSNLQKMTLPEYVLFLCLLAQEMVELTVALEWKNDGLLGLSLGNYAQSAAEGGYMCFPYS